MAKAPTGLTMARNGASFTCKWKRGESYNKGEQFGTAASGYGWTNINLGSSTTSRAFSVALKNYYPYKNKYLYTAQFRVRGKKGSKWSAWSRKSFAVAVPNVPTLTVTPDSGVNNRCVFAWSTAVSTSDARIFVDVEYQSMLVSESNVTDGSKLTWKNTGDNDWRTGTGTASSSVTINESIAISDGSHTRWFRVRARGPRGASAWRYGKRVYAAPYQKIIEEATATKTDNGYQAYVKWSGASNYAFPTDTLTVDYTMATPDPGMVCPAGATPTTAVTMAQYGATNAVSFPIDRTLGFDEALYARVNSIHLLSTTYGDWTFVSAGRLTAPTLTNVVTDPSTFRATITATNGSAVSDSFLAVLYRTASQPDDFAVLGIIPNGGTSVTVQCPDWTGETIQFGVYAVVGSYEATTRADGVGSYEITASMESAITWQAVSMPDAPEEISLSATNVQGSVKVTWDWSWEEADNAVISWADHEDAWESTNEPSEYTVSNVHASEWTIAGLETGRRWYVRVRLVNGTGDTAIYGPWSQMATIDLSSAPSIPTLTLSSGIIPVDGSVSAYWGYVSTDGTGQAYAEICEATIGSGGITYGDVIAQTETAQHVTIYADEVGWNQGEEYYLCVRVVSASGLPSDSWSDPVPVIIAEPMECEITDTSLEDVQIAENERTYTGDLISFTSDDVVPIAESLVVDLDPIQDLHGYDAPWVGGAGKNKLATITGGTNNGITATVNEDGSVTVNGTATSAANFYGDYFTLKAGTYIVSGGSNVLGSNWVVYLDGVSGSTAVDLNGARITVNEDTQTRGVVRVYGGKAPSNITIYPMVCLASETNPTTYAPYENICPISGHTEVDVTVSPTTDAEDGNTYNTPLGQTVYGGTVDVVSGLLTGKMGIITADDFTNYVNGSSSGGLHWAEATVDVTANAEAISSMLEWKTTGAGWNSTTECFATESGKIRVYTSATSLADFKTKFANLTVCYPLSTPQTYQLTPQQIALLLGENNIFSSDNMTITVADNVIDTKALTELPLTITVSGAGDGGTTTVAIERASDYHVDRPDGTDFNGYEGETIAVYTQTGDDEITIERDDLLGTFDDGAFYRIVATVADGIGQTDTETLEFIVQWAHQAVMPTATASMDGTVALITPTQPTGYADGDTVDIYRLSVDRPELIYTGAEMGTQYVDPFPAIGEYGGHRIVYRTIDGDYITETNDIAWLDLGETDGDNLDVDYSIINFGSDEIHLRLNLDVSNAWQKDFKQTKYLGGSVQGDWNKGYSRTGSLKGLVVTTDDPETIQLLKLLAVWDRDCHMRTPDGSSFTCNIDVSDELSHSTAGKGYSVTMNVTRIDPEELDGQPFSVWNYEES